MEESISHIDTRYSLMSTMLAIAVPLRILQLQERGGPTDEDWFNCQVFNELLSMPPADTALISKSKVEGVTAMMFNELAKTVAVLSYTPGGISCFGQHWETTVPKVDKTGA